MPLPDAAESYYRRQQRISLSTLALARRLWAKLGEGDFDAAWRTLGPQLLVVLMSGQRAAVDQAAAYVPAVLDELNVDSDPVGALAPAGFVGYASDGRALDSLLYQPIIRARTALGAGASLVDALGSGGALLDRIVSTQVVDAGRAAESVATAVRPEIPFFVRMLVLPSCDRCVVLAGRRYAWDAGFDRHPECDCRSIPCSEAVVGDLTVDPLAAIKSGKVTALSEADTLAITRDGADPYKVINAKRGMSTEQVFGQKLKVTTEGTSRRAGNRTVWARINGKNVKVRPRPQALYDMAAGDRVESERLLRLYGYIT